MSLNYTQIFTRLGRGVFWKNFWVQQQHDACLAPTTGEADNIQAQFTGGDQALVPNIQNTVTSQAGTMQSWAQVAKTQVCDAELASLQGDLNAPTNDAATILSLLGNQMVIDSQAIQESVISTPVVTPASANVGNGLLKCSLINVFGQTDQRVIDQTISLVCTSSQYSGGTAGAETFSMTGQPTISSYAYGTQGLGTGPTLTTQGNNALTNGDFETWSTGAPTGWTIGIGSALIVQNTSTPHSGESCMALTGDGSTATATLYQTIASSVVSNTVYAIGIWLRKSGTVTAGSTLTVSVLGTGAATQALVSMDPNSLTTSYVLHWLFFSTANTVGNSIPVDYRFQISWTSANTAGASAVILVDDAVYLTPVDFGNVKYAMFRGSAGFVVRDQIEVDTSVYSAGVFQSFLSQIYDIQLPSSGSPSISDALAE